MLIQIQIKSLVLNLPFAYLDFDNIDISKSSLFGSTDRISSESKSSLDAFLLTHQMMFSIINLVTFFLPTEFRGGIRLCYLGSVVWL